jgi:type 2 lantibiotic biosynthesis protein LanM
MALARRRIRRLDDHDIQRQEWFIRASLATLMPSDFGIGEATNGPYRLEENGLKPDRERLRNGARDIADRLVETAVLGEQDACWIGLEMLAGANWDIGPVGMDLYSGVPGIALFLAHAGAILEDEHYTALARRGLVAMLRHFVQFGGDLPGIGGYEGWGGTLYALANMAALWHDTALLDRGEDVVDVLAGFIDQDEDFGVQRGAAGAIGALIAYHRCRPSTRTLRAASACGDHLLVSAQIMPHGMGWVPPRSSSPPLTGFAHGASGIAWALFALARETGAERYRIAAQQAVAYERSLFSPEAGNWPDLRQNDLPAGQEVSHPLRYPVAWCHGATGIGLTRLSAFESCPDVELYNEALAALGTTVRHGFGKTHCLCHGDMGNLELMLQAGRILDDEKWLVEARRLACQVLNSIDRHGWYCGGPGGVELPGLMPGIAGIGYQMLRVAEPEQVPSVLTLACPVW